MYALLSVCVRAFFCLYVCVCVFVSVWLSVAACLCALLGWLVLNSALSKILVLFHKRSHGWFPLVSCFAEASFAALERRSWYPLRHGPATGHTVTAHKAHSLGPQHTTSSNTTTQPATCSLALHQQALGSDFPFWAFLPFNHQSKKTNNSLAYLLECVCVCVCVSGCGCFEQGCRKGMRVGQASGLEEGCLRFAGCKLC